MCVPAFPLSYFKSKTEVKVKVNGLTVAKKTVTGLLSKNGFSTQKAVRHKRQNGFHSFVFLYVCNLIKKLLL